VVFLVPLHAKRAEHLLPARLVARVGIDRLEAE
jgi:hypothetical protein